MADGGFAGPSGRRDWAFLQCFGERTANEEVHDADIISAVEFDADGSHLATGDRGGRVVLFERVDPPPSDDTDPDARASAPPPAPRAPAFEFRYLTEFQSHEPEFDYLKSLEIEEKVNRVRWVRSGGGGGGGGVGADGAPPSRPRLLLSTNDKTVKLWKVYEKSVVTLAGFNADAGRGSSGGGGAWQIAARAGGGSPASPPPRLPRSPPKPRSLLVDPSKPGTAAPAVTPLVLPRVVARASALAAKCARAYAGAHAYHVHSLSLCSDGETFLSSDDLRVNLWHLDAPAAAPYVLVDMKPERMEDLTEVITVAEFHPTHCHLFAHASSRGVLRLADMRSAALCDRPALAMAAPAPPGARSFFSEIIGSIADAKFCGRDGRKLVTRDYMALTLWDAAAPREPVAVYPVHESLRPRLCDLYENDCVFDKFGVAVSGDGACAATGTYSSLFRVVPSPGDGGGGGDRGDPASVAGPAPRPPGLLLEASRDPLRRRPGGAGAPPPARGRFGLPPRPPAPGDDDAAGAGAGDGGDDGAAALGADLSAKMLHLAWHPDAPVIAAAASNSLYLYHAT